MVTKIEKNVIDRYFDIFGRIVSTLERLKLITITSKKCNNKL